MLAAEGLVHGERGVRYHVRQRYSYRVTVTAFYPGDWSSPEAERDFDAVADAMAAAEQAEPAVTDLDLTVRSGLWTWTITAECSDAARAAVIGLAVARASATGNGWNWTAASVSAEPSDEG